MSRILELLPETVAFEQHLLTVRNQKNSRLRYTPRTAHAYAVTVNKVLSEHKSFVQALVEAGPTPKWMMLHNAGLAWVRWKHDTVAEEALKELEPPEINYRETQPPTVNVWDRIKAVIRERVPEPLRSVLLLIATTGLRIDEVFRLSRRQVTLAAVNTEIVIVQKGKHKRDWAPSADDRQLLTTLLQHAGWNVLQDIVYPKPDMTATEQQNYYAAYHVVRRHLQALCDLAGVEYVRPHRYRHAVANDLIQVDGATVVDVQKALGHAYSQTTDKFYLHSDAVRQASLKDKAAAKRRGGA